MISKKILLPYSPAKNKSVVFFSASASGDARQLIDFGIREVLISYHYITKAPTYYSTEMLPLIKKDGGLFMTDSGGFSFIASINFDETPEAFTEAYWIPYLTEYTNWLYAHRDYIYVAANLDLDSIVGREVVDRWNEKYFKPLEQYMNIVYVAHRDMNKEYFDFNGMKRLEEYCQKHQYVGVSQEYKDSYNKIYTIANKYGTRIHGFAWTEVSKLKERPMHSVDSTTWLGGARYGTSYVYDGKNFRANDYKKKFYRKGDRLICEANGINYEKLLRDNVKEVNKYNLLGWLGARKEILQAANTKLKHKPVSHYIVNA